MDNQRITKVYDFQYTKESHKGPLDITISISDTCIYKNTYTRIEEVFALFEEFMQVNDCSYKRDYIKVNSEFPTIYPEIESIDDIK